MAKKMSGFELWFTKIQFSGKRRLAVYRKLSGFLRNNVKLTEALDIMWRHASDDGKKPKNPVAVAIHTWRKQIENGKPLASAMQGWIPDVDRVVIEAGENSNLADALDNAGFIYTSQKRIKSAIIGGSIYPIVLVFAAVMLMYIVGTSVIPSFDSVYPRENWTGLSAQMAALSDFVQGPLVGVIVSIIVLMVLIVWSMPRWIGALRVKVDDYPPYSIYRLVNGSGFLLSVSALIQAGVKQTDSLRMIKKGSRPWLDERLTKTLFHMNNGLDIGDALHKTRMNFPDKETVNDIRSFAKISNFEEMLQKLGRENLQDTVEKIEAQMSTFKTLAMVLLAGMFGWIVSGIFALQQMIMANTG